MTEEERKEVEERPRWVLTRKIDHYCDSRSKDPTVTDFIFNFRFKVRGWKLITLIEDHRANTIRIELPIGTYTPGDLDGLTTLCVVYGRC